MVKRKVNCKDCAKRKARTEEEKKYFTSRLNVIEGQIRGIKQMIEEERYCDEILVQLSAVNNSLKSVGTKLLKNHLETCVVNDIKNDNLDILDDVMDLFSRLYK